MPADGDGIVHLRVALVCDCRNLKCLDHRVGVEVAELSRTRMSGAAAARRLEATFARP